MSCPDVIVEGMFPRELFPTNVADTTPIQVYLRDMESDTLLVRQLATSHPSTMKRSSIIPTDSVPLP